MKPHVQRLQLIMSHVYVMLVICTYTHVYYIYIYYIYIYNININNSDKSSYKISYGFCSAPGTTVLRGRIEGQILGDHIQQLGTGHNEEKLQAPAEQIWCTAAPEGFLIELRYPYFLQHPSEYRYQNDILIVVHPGFSNIHQNIDIKMIFLLLFILDSPTSIRI